MEKEKANAKIKVNEKGLSIFSLSEQVAIVTGGGSGLGRAMALGLSEAGASVAVVDISAEGAKRVADEIRAKGGKAISIQTDVTRSPQVQAMTQEVLKAWGKIDVLVNSAGVVLRNPALEYTEEQWDRVIGINLKGTFLCCQTIGKVMVAKEKGSIVNIASIGGLVAYPGCIAYLASKGGVVQITRGLAVEWAKANVRVNAIAPFVMETPMVKAVREKEPAHFQRMVEKAPIGRVGQPEEMIGAVIFLASSASSLTTGHILAVDGGYVAQ